MKAWKAGCALGSLLALSGAVFAAEMKQVADPDGAYRMSAPSDWRVQRTGQVTMVSSEDGRANVVVFAGPREATTVDQWFQAMIPALQKQIPGWNLVGKQPLTVAGREGLLARAESLMNGVAMHADYVLVQGTKNRVMLSCNCPKADFPANQLTFARIIASLELPEAAPAPAPAAPASAPAAPAATPQIKWERYVSKNNVFTLLKPAGWQVNEALDAGGGYWFCSIADPTGAWQASVHHGVSPAGADVNALANHIVASMLRAAPSLRLAPTVRVRDAGKKRVIVFEGTYTDARNVSKQFRCMVSGGDGSMLCQNIEAPAGQLGQAAPVLLQTLANLRVANLFQAGGSGAAAPPQPVALVAQQLASGWARFSAPAGWQAQDLGKGSCIISDPARRLFFVVGGAEFITPRYFVRGVKGVLSSEMLSPHDALAFATTQAGLGADFRSTFVKPRPDLVQTMRGFAGPLRAVAAEDFAYTFTKQGKPYTGFSCGGCSGDAMGATWRLWHFTIMAPSEDFEAALPTLAAVMGSYEINGEMAGRRIADNMANYYAGLRNLSRQIAMNSEQMRRENLQVMINNDRLRDYTSYQTTRMIMGDFHYLAGSSGYVVSNPDGLYTPDGQVISREPYGGSITQGMQEINSMQLFERVFQAKP